MAARLDADVTLQIVHTRGDKLRSINLQENLDKGFFTAELEQRLLDGEVDLVVHSLKDLPTQQADGLMVGATPTREVRGVVLLVAPHAVDTDGLVFCSGQTPIDPGTGELRAGGVEAQTHQCFDNLFAVLADGGLGPEHVVKVNVYLTDMDDFAEMNGVYAEYFKKDPPGRTCVAVSALPAGASVEIEVTAIV